MRTTLGDTYAKLIAPKNVSDLAGGLESAHGGEARVGGKLRAPPQASNVGQRHSGPRRDVRAAGGTPRGGRDSGHSYRTHSYRTPSLSRSRSYTEL